MAGRLAVVAKSTHTDAKIFIGGGSRPFERRPAMDRKFISGFVVQSLRRAAAIVSSVTGFAYGGG
jgi:hypothetical protein